MAAAGYSGTPYAKKPGVEAGSRKRVVNAPPGYFDLFRDMPADNPFTQGEKASRTSFFILQKNPGYCKETSLLKKKSIPMEALWISWPKNGEHGYGCNRRCDEANCFKQWPFRCENVCRE